MGGIAGTEKKKRKKAPPEKSSIRNCRQKITHTNAPQKKQTGKSKVNKNAMVSNKKKKVGLWWWWDACVNKFLKFLIPSYQQKQGNSNCHISADKDVVKALEKMGIQQKLPKIPVDVNIAPWQTWGKFLSLISTSTLKLIGNYTIRHVLGKNALMDWLIMGSGQ